MPENNRSRTHAKRHPTLADIAKEVGVTTATVSYVLNGRHLKRISQATRTKILAVARKLKYAPDTHARSLVTGKNLAIAAYYPHPIEFALQDPHSTLMLRGILQKAALFDYSVQVLIEGHNLTQPAVDGWICLMGKQPLKTEITRGKPVVYINPDWGLDPSSLHADEVSATRLLTSKLRTTSRRVLFVPSHTPYPSTFNHTRRYEWLAAGLEEAAEMQLFDTPDSSLSNDEHTRLVVESIRKEHFDTIITATDETGVRILSELVRQGVSVPGDVQLVAFDDTGIASLISPRLSTIDLGIQELGYRGAALLLSRLYGANQQQDEALFSPPKPVFRKGVSTR